MAEPNVVDCVAERDATRSSGRQRRRSVCVRAWRSTASASGSRSWWTARACSRATVRTWTSRCGQLDRAGVSAVEALEAHTGPLLCAVEQDKWKNLQNRANSQPRGRRQARALVAPPSPSHSEAPTAAEEVEEIESSNEDARRPPRHLKKKQRVAAEATTTSFAAVRTAELSQCQSQDDDEDERAEETPAPSYTIFSPHADHSFEVEVVSYETEEGTDAVDRVASAEKKASKSTHASPKPHTQRSVRATGSGSQSTGSAREAEEAAVVALPGRKSSTARSRPVQAKPTQGHDKSTARVVELEFVTDATFPKVRACRLAILLVLNAAWLTGASN